MYEKQNFVKGQKLKAEQLNHMEEGIAAAHEQSGGAGVTIDLLWENPDISDIINPMGDRTITIPNLRDYDKIEVVHVTDDSWVASNCIDVEILEGWGTELFTACGENQFTRRVEVIGVNGTLAIYFQDDGRGEGIGCIPVRIYGIKGVSKKNVASSFSIDGDYFTFMRGMTWAEWCDSQYNTIGLSYGGGMVGTNDSETLADSDDIPVAQSDEIVGGMGYTLL